MNNHTEPQQPPSFGLDDVLYIFFRHKWKILFFSLLGLGVAAGLYFTEKTEFRSQAKLLVRYITDKRNPLSAMNPEAASTTRSLDPRDAAIMAAEAEILRSVDSISEAVRAVGPTRVLEAYGGGTNVTDAARLAMNNLRVDIGKNMNVMVLTLSHRDQDVAQRLLEEIIAQYMRRHLEIHHSLATYEQVQEQTEQARLRMERTMDELMRAKRNANVSNLRQARSDLSVQSSKLQEEALVAEADLAQARALLEERRSYTNLVAQADTGAETNQPVAIPQQPSALEIARYNQMLNRIVSLRQQESELLLTFNESSKRVQQVRQQVQDLEQQMANLQIDPEYLASLNATKVAGGGNAAGPRPYDWQSARANIVALEARYNLLTNRLAEVQAASARLDQVETSIAELELREKTDKDAYSYYQKTLAEIRLDTTIDATRRNNISVIQAATRINPDSKKLIKKLGAISAAGVAFGILLALFSDFVLNPTVKRPKELETSLRLPVYATIPNFSRRKLKDKRPRKMTKALEKNGEPGFRNGEIPPWDENDPLLPFYEAMRDRVVMSYTGDIHKPKVVGLTSCNHGAGVTRLATGLAASLSRDAERHVLMVGLQRNKVAVSGFAKGRPTNGIEAPESETKTDKELVAQNLQSLVSTGRNLAGASVVQSFSELLPKLQICDYDYIIFDLPPLTQTSGSLRLASQMERTILVVEAEETAKEKVKRARSLLKGTHLSTILNKTRSYGPKSLQADI